jgi:hypothetical protein
VDTIRGSDFQTRGLLLALDVGEPFRVARGLAAEATFTAAAGEPVKARTATLLSRADAIARSQPGPLGLALVQAARGLSAYLEGRWPDALGHLDAAAAVMRERCTDVSWELATAQQYAMLSLIYMGRLRELARRAPAVLQEAEQRGNRYAATMVRAALTNMVWLVGDDPERARAEAARAVSQWSHRAFHLQHYWHLLAQSQIDLYEGKASVVDRVESSWRPLDRSLLLRIQVVRLAAVHLRARASLLGSAGMAAAAGQRRALEARALAGARRLEGESATWGHPLAKLLRAAVARRRGDEGAAQGLLGEAASGFEAAHMELYAAAARARLGELGDASAAGRAHAYFREQAVERPERFVNLLAPA